MGLHRLMENDGGSQRARFAQSRGKVSSAFGCTLDLLMNQGKIPAARLGRRPERRPRTGSPRCFVADAPCGACDASNYKGCALNWRDCGSLVRRAPPALVVGESS